MTETNGQILGGAPKRLCEWGAAGVRSLASNADVVVIVDVLSFSTCVDIAISQGGRVFPFDPDAAGALAFAEKRGAHLAFPRGHGRFSLSSASFLELESGESVVLPSPNGAMATLASRPKTPGEHASETPDSFSRRVYGQQCGGREL